MTGNSVSVRRESASPSIYWLLVPFVPKRQWSSCNAGSGPGSGSGPRPGREGVNQLLLYCRVGIGFHLQILPSGSVGGVHKPTEHCECSPLVWPLTMCPSLNPAWTHSAHSLIFILLLRSELKYGPYLRHVPTYWLWPHLTYLHIKSPLHHFTLHVFISSRLAEGVCYETRSGGNQRNQERLVPLPEQWWTGLWSRE